MARVAFRLRLRAEHIERYDEAHRNVWPELKHLLKSVGISRYSIFRRGLDLFFYMEVGDFDRAWDEIEKSAVNRRWQAEMAPMFEPVPDQASGERFAMMREVFYLE